MATRKVSEEPARVRKHDPEDRTTREIAAIRASRADNAPPSGAYHKTRAELERQMFGEA